MVNFILPVLSLFALAFNVSAREGPRRDLAERAAKPSCPAENPQAGASLISQLHLQPVCTYVVNDLVKTITITVTQGNSGTSTVTSYTDTTVTTPVTQSTTTTVTTDVSIATTAVATSTVQITSTVTVTIGTAATTSVTVTVEPVGPAVCTLPVSSKKRAVRRAYGLPSNWLLCALTQIRDACEVALGRPAGQSTYTITKTVMGGPTTTTLGLESTSVAPLSLSLTTTTTTTTAVNQVSVTSTTTTYIATTTATVYTLDPNQPTVTTGPTVTGPQTQVYFEPTLYEPRCFTVATQGLYTINGAAGAGGDGHGPSGSPTQVGGSVYVALVTQTLRPSLTYTAVVGQKGFSLFGQGAGGGGGGTFVFSTDGVVMVLGGGGGGNADGAGAANGQSPYDGFQETKFTGGGGQGFSPGGGGGAGFSSAGGSGQGAGGQSAAGNWDGGSRGSAGGGNGGYGGGGQGALVGGGGGGGGYGGGQGGDADQGGGPGDNWVNETQSTQYTILPNSGRTTDGFFLVHN